MCLLMDCIPNDRMRVAGSMSGGQLDEDALRKWLRKAPGPGYFRGPLPTTSSPCAAVRAVIPGSCEQMAIPEPISDVGSE